MEAEQIRVQFIKDLLVVRLQGLTGGRTPTG